MANFKGASIWMKLAFLHTIIAWALDLFAMTTSGWASAIYCSNGSKCGWYIGVEALEVIGFILLLTALVLVLCMVLLDELKGNKVAMICFIVFILVAAFCMIVGVAIYESNYDASYSTMLCVMGAICAILAGIFAILELCSVAAK